MEPRERRFSPGEGTKKHFRNDIRQIWIPRLWRRRFFGNDLSQEINDVDRLERTPLGEHLVHSCAKREKIGSSIHSWRSRPADRQESGDDHVVVTSTARTAGIPDGATERACRAARR